LPELLELELSSLLVEPDVLDCAAAASALDSVGIAASAEAEWCPCVPGWAARATTAPPAKAPAATTPITYRVI
jgi:hypothetical protein